MTDRRDFMGTVGRFLIGLGLSACAMTPEQRLIRGMVFSNPRIRQDIDAAIAMIQENGSYSYYRGSTYRKIFPAFDEWCFLEYYTQPEADKAENSPLYSILYTGFGRTLVIDKGADCLHDILVNHEQSLGQNMDGANWERGLHLWGKTTNPSHTIYCNESAEGYARKLWDDPELRNNVVNFERSVALTYIEFVRQGSVSRIMYDRLKSLDESLQLSSSHS